MIAVAALLLLAAPQPPACVRSMASSDAPTHGVRHVFQNGYPIPLQLWWVDSARRPVNLGTIAPGGHVSLQTFVDHGFVLTDPRGRCIRNVRIGEVFAGTYLGTSRYRTVAVRSGWHVMVDKAVDHAATRSIALTTLSRLLAEAEAVLPPALLAPLRRTPIFLHNHAGPGAMYHSDPDWLIAHGRTVELLNAIELADAEVFVEMVANRPGMILHELAHAHYARLSQAEQAEVEQAYRRAIDGGRYRAVARYDGTITDAYARYNAQEYFAELSEAYFSRNDFFPFTRAELTAYDPDGARLMVRIWQ